MKKTGIFGGSFDPVTYAHLVAAEWLYRELNLQKLLFIPNWQNPLKTDLHPAESEIRLKMLRESIEVNPNFEIETVEIERMGKSYTIDTIRALKEKYPETHFVLLVGLDVINNFSNWKNPELILENVELITFSRFGYKVDPGMDDIRERIREIEIPDINISSTLVRQLVSGGRPISHLVPPSVEKIIYDECLYR